MNNEQTARNEGEFKPLVTSLGKPTVESAKASKQKPALYLASQRVTTEKLEKTLPRAEVRVFKRIFDVALASTLLVLTAPLLVMVALAVRLSSKGPIVLKQIRLTDGGRKFAMYKFRSMTVDAETHSGPVMAQKNDVRVTRVGKILRTTRLDELPQLINVIRGDMSLVGPRPERPEIAAQLRNELPHFDRRLEVKAGLTGLAQVKMGYSSCTDSYRRKLALDRLYVRHQSFALDLWIAVRTIWVMVTGRGAL